mgnify:CR=1 FL=1
MPLRQQRRKGKREGLKEVTKTTKEFADILLCRGMKRNSKRGRARTLAAETAGPEETNSRLSRMTMLLSQWKTLKALKTLKIN